METETERDPLDVADDEMAELLAEKKAMGCSWKEFIRQLGQTAEAAQRRCLLAERLQAVIATDGVQLPLFTGVVPRFPGAAMAAPEPRKPRRVMMHADGGFFRCQKCNESAEILSLAGMTDSTRKRGVPCPRCNGSESRQDAPGEAVEA